jgi:uncharacterized protein
MILSCGTAGADRSGRRVGGRAGSAAAQPDPIAAAVTASAISATVSARRRRGVNHAGLRAAAQARMPVAAAVAVAAVAMHCAHMQGSMAGPRRSQVALRSDCPAVEALELVLFCAWCFVVAVAGGAVGLVLGNIRLPVVLLVASSPAAGAGANIGISGVAAFAAAAAHIRAGRINWRLFAWMAPPSMAGAVVGGLVSGAISDTALLIVIGVTLLYFGIDLLRKEGRRPDAKRSPRAADAEREPAAPEPPAADAEREPAAPERSPHAADAAPEPRPAADHLDVRAAVLSGALIGLLGGLVGLILGALRMPALLRWVGEVPHRAVGTNLAVGFWVGVAGVAGHLPGGVDWTALGAGAAASVPGALLGARLTGRMSERQLLRAIGAVLVVAGVATAGQAL